MNSSTSSFNPRRALVLFASVAASVGLSLFAASEALVRAEVEQQDEFVSHVRLFETSQAVDAAFGDSHVARGFVPPEGMINLAYPSEGIEHLDWKIRTYFARRLPGRVIIQADPHLFAPYRLRNHLGDYPARFAEVAKANEWVPRISESRYRANLVNYWSSYVKSGGDLVSRIKVLDNGALLSPGDLSTGDARWRAYQTRSRIASHRIHPMAAVAQRLETYSRLLDFLAERGARVCMANFPLSPDYRSAMQADKHADTTRERQAILTFFETEAERTGARYVDLRAMTSDRSEFRDVDHLNGASALKYGSAITDACFGERAAQGVGLTCRTRHWRDQDQSTASITDRWRRSARKRSKNAISCKNVSRN